jgi:hypothetical protein
MDIVYILSDSDDGNDSLTARNLRSNDYVKSTTIRNSVVDQNLHQTLNYASLEKHSSSKIVDICKEVDLIYCNITKPKKDIKKVSKLVYKSIDGPNIKIKKTRKRTNKG